MTWRARYKREMALVADLAMLEMWAPRQFARESQANNFERQALGQGAATKHKVGVGAGCRTESKLAVLVQRVGAKGGEVLMGGDDQRPGLARVKGDKPAFGPGLDGSEICRQPHQVPDRYLRNPHFPLSLLMLAQTPRTRKTCSHTQSFTKDGSTHTQLFTKNSPTHTIVHQR
jgi:hypothetical protein